MSKHDRYARQERIANYVISAAIEHIFTVIYYLNLLWNRLHLTVLPVSPRGTPWRIHNTTRTDELITKKTIDHEHKTITKQIWTRNISPIKKITDVTAVANRYYDQSMTTITNSPVAYGSMVHQPKQLPHGGVYINNQFRGLTSRLLTNQCRLLSVLM